MERIEKELEKQEEVVEGRFEALVERAIREGKAGRAE